MGIIRKKNIIQTNGPSFNGQNINEWNVKITGYPLNDNYGNTFSVEDGILKLVMMPTLILIINSATCSKSKNIRITCWELNTALQVIRPTVVPEISNWVQKGGAVESWKVCAWWSKNLLKCLNNKPYGKVFQAKSKSTYSAQRAQEIYNGLAFLSVFSVNPQRGFLCGTPREFFITKKIKCLSIKNQIIFCS